MKKWFKWFTESNRWKHFLYAIPCGVISFFFALGLATGMEFKDYQHSANWDWLDWSCTVVGGIIGQVLAVLLLSL